MKLKDIVHLSSKNDSEINLCKIAEHSNTGITFIVDEGLSKPKYHWPKSKGIDVATWMLRNKQIDDESLQSDIDQFLRSISAKMVDKEETRTEVILR